MASTAANIVSMLIEKPIAPSTATVPSNTTGTAMVGISVARKFCRNRNITKNTSPTASSRVKITLRIDTRTNGVVSNGVTTFRPFGKYGLSCSSCACTPSAVSSALAPVASEIATPVAGSRL